MEIWKAALFIGLAQAVLLIGSSLLAPKNSPSKSKWYLAILLFSITSLFFFEFTSLFNFHHLIELGIQIISIASILLIGPSLYLYFTYTLNGNEQSSTKPRIHYIPFFLLLGFLVYVEWYYNGISSPVHQGIPWYLEATELVKLIHLSTYLISSLMLLKTFPSTKDKLCFDGNSKWVLRWFKLLLMFFSILVILSLTYFVFLKYLHIELPIGGPEFILSILILGLYTLTFLALRYPLTSMVMDGVYVVKLVPKYKTSSLLKSDLDYLSNKLLNHLDKQKSYLDENLKIEHLAQEMGVSTHHLSQTINQRFQKSFNDLINQYRVEEFKRKILNPKEAGKTILSIAHESGFSSKASFNRIFKTITSQTPSEFKKLHSSFK